MIVDIKLLHGDCLELIKDIPDKSIDLVLTDPPYVNVVKEEWDKQNPFTYELVNELYRVCKDTGSIYVWCGIGEKSRSLLDFIPKLDSKFHFKDLITWKKQRGIGMRKGWLYTREECLWYVKNNKQFIWNKEEQYDVTDKRLFSLPNNKSDYKRWSNVWTDIKEVAGGMKSAQYHPTQKPIEAFERIIKLHTTNENNVVLDCFMGSGTTAIACINTNRNFIGIELDDKYFEIAKRRISEARNDNREPRRLFTL